MWKYQSIFVVLAVFAGQGLASTIEDLAVLDNLLKNNNYDRRVTPANHMTPNHSTPTNVEIEFVVRSVSPPCPQTMDYKVDLLLRQKWRDERLKNTNLTKPLNLNDPVLVKSIWKPEVYFPNAKEADFQFVTVPNVLVRIAPNGDILYMLRLRLVFSCSMNLRGFPFDRQVCTIEVASFSKTTEELVLHWKSDEPVVLNKENSLLSQFDVTDVVSTVCNSSFVSGNYTCLRAEFHLRRLWGFYFVRFYLPTFFMVIISWVCFWLDADSELGRLTLGIITLRSVSSTVSSIEEKSELTSSDLKAMDIWFGTCTAFVFVALFESIFVMYWWRKEGQEGNILGGVAYNSKPRRSVANKTNRMHGIGAVQNRESSLLNAESSLADGDDPTGRKTDLEGPKVDRGIQHLEQAKKIDETSRYLFPLFFAAFMIIYWTYIVLF